jgi:hypothetical protein
MNMQNPSTIHTDNQPRIFGPVSPEIDDALRTAHAAEFRLENEYHIFDWEARLELAEDLRGLAEELPDELAAVASGVAEALESDAADFSDWETRCYAAGRCRVIVRGLKSNRQEVTTNA